MGRLYQVKLYTRYLLNPYYKMLLLLAPVTTGIYLLIEFFDKIDNVTNAGLSYFFLLHYLGFQIPQILFETWPILLSLAGLLALAFLARGGELLAFRTLGFSSWALARPYILLALLLSVGFVVAEELVLPESTYHQLYLWATKVKKQKPRGLLVKGQIYFRGVHSFFVGRVLDPDARHLKDVVYVKVDQEGLPLFIIWAQRAAYKGNHLWIFEKGFFKRRRTDFVPRWFQKHVLKLEFTPETVLVVKRIPRTQHLWELWKQRSFLKRAGLPTQAPDAELAYRIFYPFAAPGLLALALPMLLGERGRHALGRGVSLGLLAIFLGLATFLGFKALGDTGRIPALWALPVGLAILYGTSAFLFYKRRF